MESLPIRYHLEVYERSLVNDPSMSVDTDSPLPAFAVGDFFNHRMYDGWSNPPGEDEAFRIKEVEHIVWTVEKSHVGYKLMLCLETVTRKL